MSGLSKWLEIYKDTDNIRTDKTDKTKSRGVVAVLSAPTPSIFGNIANLKGSKMPIEGTVKTDKTSILNGNVMENKKYSSMSLDEFEKLDTFLEVSSHVLGETIYLASDQKAIEKCGTLAGVFYTAEELRQLIRSETTHDEIKAIHETKKIMGGEIIK